MAAETVNRVTVDLREELRFDATNGEGSAIAMDTIPTEGGLSPMETVLAALAGCTAMDVISILRKKRQDVTAYRVEVAGRRADEHPRVFTDIALRHVITGRNVAPEAVRRSIELSEERYCSVHAMLSKSVAIHSEFEIVPATD